MRVNTILLSAEKEGDKDTKAQKSVCAAQLGNVWIVLSYDFRFCSSFILDKVSCDLLAVTLLHTTTLIFEHYLLHTAKASIPQNSSHM